MKIIVLLCLLALAVLSAADETDVEDLGQITERRAICLTACKIRTDFLEFRIVFFPQGAFQNPIPMVTTNSLILLSDLAQLPSGPIIMSVQSVCKDSAESPITFHKFEIMRSNPSATKVSVVNILVPEPPQSATNELRKIIEHRAAVAALNLPPTPPPPTPPPMPQGTNKTYGERMDEFYSRQSRK